MSGESKKPLPIPRIRTFAGDLKAEREKKQLAEKLKAIKETPVKKVAAKKDVEPVTPIPIPKLHKRETTEVKAAVPLPTKKKTASPKPVPIPLYHELQDQIKKIESQVEKTKPVKVPPIKVSEEVLKPKPSKVAESKPADTPKAKPKVNVDYDSTIITDTKTHNNNFFPDIVASISQWFKKITTPRPKATPKYSVSETSTRKGVIQKATTKSGSIFTDENESLKKQIRQRQQADKENQKKAVLDEPETVWSPYTEAGYELLEAPDPIQNVRLETRKPIAPIPIPVPEVKESEKERPEEKAGEELIEKVEDKKNEEAKKVEKVDKVERVEAESVQEKAPVVDTNDTIDPDELRWAQDKPVEIVAPQIKTPPAAEPTAPAPAKTKPHQEVTVKADKPSKKEPAPKVTNIKKPLPNNLQAQKALFSNIQIEKVDTNTISVVLLMVIICLVSLVFVGRVFYQYINSSPTAEAVTSAVIPTLSTAELEVIALDTTNLSRLPTLINERRASFESSLVEIVISDTIGNELSAAYIFDLLDISILPSMEQSITSVRFLSLNGGEEVILLKFNNEDNVRGGFLSWESNLVNDLSTVFNTGTNFGNFTDKQTLNMDTRETMSTSGRTITYTLVDDTTALISSNRSDLENIISLEFNQ